MENKEPATEELIETFFKERLDFKEVPEEMKNIMNFDSLLKRAELKMKKKKQELEPEPVITKVIDEEEGSGSEFYTDDEESLTPALLSPKERRRGRSKKGESVLSSSFCTGRRASNPGRNLSNLKPIVQDAETQTVRRSDQLEQTQHTTSDKSRYAESQMLERAASTQNGNSSKPALDSAYDLLVLRFVFHAIVHILSVVAEGWLKGGLNTFLGDQRIFAVIRAPTGSMSATTLAMLVAVGNVLCRLMTMIGAALLLRGLMKILSKHCPPKILPEWAQTDGQAAQAARPRG